MLRRVAVLALALAALLAPAFRGVPVADAHATLTRSSPESGARLAEGPASIDLWFTEPLESRLSGIELYTSAGQKLPIDGIQVGSSDPRHMSGLPRKLEPGLYTVVYRTLSTYDGHSWSGSFSFTVLNPDGSVPEGTAYSVDDGQRAIGDILGRWFVFVGLSVIVGGGGIALLALPSGGKGSVETRRRARRLYRRLSLAALVLVAVGGVLQLQHQHDALDGSLGDILSDTRFGRWWLLRHLFVLGAVESLALSFLATARRRTRAEIALLAATALFGVAGLIAVAMVSHAAAAPGSFWAISADIVHLTLAAAWIGGLVMMAALLFRLRRLRATARAELPALEMIARFSVFAALTLYALGVTGVIRSLGELPTTSALTDSTYGRLLLVKLALIAPLLAVAFINRSIVRKHAQGQLSPREAARRFRRYLPVEATLGLAVLASVAVLGQEPPPARDTGSAGAAPAPYASVLSTGDLSVHLQVTPNLVGRNEFLVHPYRDDGSDPGVIDLVRLTFTPGSVVGATGGDVVDLKPVGDGTYVTEGTFLSLPGKWLVAVDVRRVGQDDISGQFTVDVKEGGLAAAGRSRFGSLAPQVSSNILFAGLLAAVGILPVFWWDRIARMGHAPSAAIFVGTAFTLFIAVTVGSSAGHTHPGGSLRNPAPGSPSSAARGATLFAANCAVCHGTTGMGDGPAAAELRPRPAPFIVHVPAHSDGDLFLFITNGLSGTAMPAWKDRLSEQDRWDLVNFLRETFSRTDR